MKSLLKATLLALPLALCSGSVVQGQIIKIDGAVTACVVGQCGGTARPVGTVLGALGNPVKLTLAAGTYSITNASLLPGADPYFSAWRFNSGNNWVWAYMMLDDATHTVINDECCGVTFSTQAGAANQAFVQNYFYTFVLGQTTTLDFITQDYYPGDNTGGVTLDIEAVSSAAPEPASLVLVATGLGIVGVVRRRRR